jgi:hypothetical protein
MGVVYPKTYRLNIPNIYSKKHKMLTMMWKGNKRSAELKYLQNHQAILVNSDAFIHVLRVERYFFKNNKLRHFLAFRNQNWTDMISCAQHLGDWGRKIWSSSPT